MYYSRKKHRCTDAQTARRRSDVARSELSSDRVFVMMVKELRGAFPQF
jgi:hypothetical protein